MSNPFRLPHAPAPRSLATVDAYFSADVETDGPIPGPYSMLSFALVYAGSFDGQHFIRPPSLDQHFYAELKPIARQFQAEALAVNRIDRNRLIQHGTEPETAMTDAAAWVREIANGRRPILVAYPLSFDWTWMYWYFVSYSRVGSPFNHSGCYDLKTAVAVKSGSPVAVSGRDELPAHLRSSVPHTHNALEDALEQAELFANVFEWQRR
ncbi:MAG: exonuclease [Thermoanaerobaculia bacterium]